MLSQEEYQDLIAGMAEVVKTCEALWTQQKELNNSLVAQLNDNMTVLKIYRDWLKVLRNQSKGTTGLFTDHEARLLTIEDYLHKLD